MSTTHLDGHHPDALRCCARVISALLLIAPSDNAVRVTVLV